MKNYKEKYEEQLDMNSCLSDKIEKLENKVDYLIQRNDILNDRIKKAIEYMEEDKMYINDYQELFEILKGEK